MAALRVELSRLSPHGEERLLHRFLRIARVAEHTIGKPERSPAEPVVQLGQGLLVSRVVADLCAGKGFEFAPAGDATLKGFDAPVTLFVVRT